VLDQTKPTRPYTKMYFTMSLGEHNIVVEPSLVWPSSASSLHRSHLIITFALNLEVVHMAVHVGVVLQPQSLANSYSSSDDDGHKRMPTRCS